MISTTTLTIDVTNQVGRVTDTTDYAAIGVNVAFYVAKGLGSIYFQGNLVDSKMTIGDPLIDLAIGDTFFDFPLELDLNGNVANGVYRVEYSLALDTTAFNFGVVSTTLPSTFEVDGSTFAWLVDFLEAGDQVRLYNPVPVLTEQFVNVSTVQLIDPGLPTASVVITVTQVISDPAWPFFSIEITNLQTVTSYTYSGCTQAGADVNFVYDCELGDSGSWSVSNATILASNETIDSLNCTVSYPSWTALTPTFNPQVVLTSLPYPSAPGTETPLATGTYTISLSEQIRQIQTDGLIITYTATIIREVGVSCAGTLCGLIPCIENLRAAHQAELLRNRISKYQVFVDNVLMYYIEALNYRACGELDKYRAAIACIQAQLDSSGCECACCDDETYYFVSNNSGVSVIEGLIQAFQFRLYNGIPGIDQDETQGVEVGALWQDFNTSILYICTVNAAGAAVWVEYYAPGVLPIAADIPTVPGSILTGTDVQAQLDQVDTLAVFDGINGLTKIGNDVVLGGTIISATTININNEIFEFVSDNAPLTLIAGDGTCLTAARAQTATTGVGQNLILETTSTSGNGANGLGSSIFFTASPASSASSFPLSTIQSFWANAATRDSKLTISTVDNGVENIGVTLNENRLVTLNAYGSGTFAGLVPAAYDLSVDASGQIIEVPTVFTYAGRTRFVGGAIVIAEYGNTTGATISISNTAVGVYIVTASSSVFVTNTVVFAQLQQAGFITAVVTSVTTITIRTFTIAGVADDAVLTSGSFIKIEIYP
jgi:hypothetical protein